jgi:hypothetical protein
MIKKSGADQVFLVRSCINHAKYLDSPLYLNFYDFRQCFDKLWLEDSIISLYKLGLQDELLALIYKTNFKARISVKTPIGRSDYFTKTSIVKQGSVTASSLCSSSTGEFCDVNKVGGIPIGKAVISTLAYVDDVVTANNNVADAKKSNRNMCFFSDKKKSPLNEDKCFILPVNCKKTDPIPILEVNSKAMSTTQTAKYLGDIFNQKGDYTDLISDRVRKGTVCMVNSMALCNDSEMGRYSLDSLILLYKTVFLPTVLYNSETWNHLTKNNISRITATQNKYLKWMLHSPRSTCTSFTLLELGLLPISHEIVYRKLSFLHHVLNLPDDDPVVSVYNEQKQYTGEGNWYNDIVQIMEEFNLDFNEDHIRMMSKDQWKTSCKKAINKHALNCLYQECVSKKKTRNVPQYEDLAQATYFSTLSPPRARAYFQLRAGVYDIRANRPYIYEETECRLCGNGNEDADHIINRCPKIPRINLIDNLHTASEEDTVELLKRVELFKEQVQSLAH